jgi:hypothetical protein
LPRCVDPACGTGVLLRALLDALVSEQGTADPDDRLALASRCLFGIDLDPIALDTCAFVLMARCLGPNDESATRSPLQFWRSIRQNLTQADARLVAVAPGAEETPGLVGVPSQLALNLTRAAEENRQAHSTTPDSSAPFDVFVANPPFSCVVMRPDKVLVRQHAYQPFVEMMWRLTRPDASASAIVLPLSIAYGRSPSLRGLRRAIRASNGTWEFAFFDRTPDSLFGDDVKTRVATAFFTRNAAAGNQIATTSLLRWSINERRNVLESLAYTTIPPSTDDSVIPKLGSGLECAIYESLRSRRGEFQSGVRRLFHIDEAGRLTSTEQALLLAGTAYNYLPVAPQAHPSASVSSFGSTSWGLAFDEPERVWCALAILSSRITYWLWRVEGDGFHLSQQFVLALPFSVLAFQEDLAPLGHELWRRMLQSPVKSVNKRRETVSYSPLPATDVVSSIDMTILTQLGLPGAFSEHLERYQRNLVQAGRGLHRRIAHHFGPEPLGEANDSTQG